MALQLLADWLRCSGEWTEKSADGLGVVRLMILGDSIQPSGTPNSYGSTGSSYLTQQARYLTRNTEADSVTAMARFDAWLATLPLGPGYVPSSSSPSNSRNGLPVDVLPGQMDPTPQLLPQQPIHAMTLPLAVSRAGGTRRGGLSGRTNPFMIKVFGRKVLATSGQGILDLELYSDLETPCDRMEATLLWGHLAPTCPDTIPGYPVEDDLLLLAQQRTEKGALSCSPDYPDIYLAGCQPGTTVQWRRAALTWRQKMSTEQDTKKGSLLVAVPRFSLSFSFVLVHLETLDCRVIRFDCSALDSAD
ncbi:unnamed protein product [Dicrocoelium dendriticum]|nr:unnamed protein product [Dicrocoelium dendriticum]